MSFAEIVELDEQQLQSIVQGEMYARSLIEKLQIVKSLKYENK